MLFKLNAHQTQCSSNSVLFKLSALQTQCSSNSVLFKLSALQTQCSSVVLSSALQTQCSSNSSSCMAHSEYQRTTNYIKEAAAAVHQCVTPPLVTRHPGCSASPRRIRSARQTATPSLHNCLHICADWFLFALLIITAACSASARSMRSA
jgi:hypothetical protein